MSGMWTWIPGEGGTISPPDLQTLIEWIMALDGVGRSAIHMKLPMGEISIIGGGNSGRVTLGFKKKEMGGGLITDPAITTDDHDIKVSARDVEPIEFFYTLTREQVCRIHNPRI